MFGTYRYILAVLVLIGHAFAMGPVHVGDAAVINFFMLSGFVMTYMIRDYYPKLGRPTFYFYIDRLLRICPQYFLFLVLTYLFWRQFDFPFFTLFFTGDDTPLNLAMNALIVPMNYAIFFPTLNAFFLVPTAWSLGLEEQFYWIFPWLVLRRWPGRIVTLLSLVVFGLAMTGQINPEVFGYRLLPGTLFMFMLGKNLADFRRKPSDRETWLWIGLIYAVCLGLALATLFISDFVFRNNREVLWGLVIGFPVLAGLSYLPRRAWDEFIGNASYGIFLCHLLVFNLLLRWRLFLGSDFQIVSAAVVFSTLLAFAGYYLVERFARKYRHRLRRRFLERQSF